MSVMEGVSVPIDLKGLVYATRTAGGKEEALVVSPDGDGCPVLPLFSDETKMEAFLAGLGLPPVEHGYGRVEHDRFLDVIDATARKHSVGLYVVVDPTHLGPGRIGGFSVLVGDEQPAGVVVADACVAPPPISTPMEADGWCLQRDARFMPTAKRLPVSFRSRGVHLYPCFKASRTAWEKLPECGCPFDDVVEVRDPSALVRALEALDGHESRLCDGESMQVVGRRRPSIECDHYAGARLPRQTGASSSAGSLLDKVFPVIGESVFFVRLRGSQDLYVPLFGSAEESAEYFSAWPEDPRPDGAMQIQSEAEFLLRFPQTIDGVGGECRVITHLGRAPDGAVTYELLAWRD
jgi:hypothetical protein